MTKQAPKPTAVSKKKAPVVKKEQQSSPVKAKKEKKPSASDKGKANGDTPKKVKKEDGGADDGEGEEEYKWWLEDEKEGGVKWDTLQHAGPLFPPEYVPHGVKMNYDGTFSNSTTRTNHPLLILQSNRPTRYSSSCS